MRRPPFRRFGSAQRAAADTYELPAKDSVRAKAAALQFLCGARTLDGIDGPTLATRYNLKPLTAQTMLEAELGRRARLL